MIKQIHVLTLFPDVIKTYFSESILGRAQKEGKVSLLVHNIRDKANNKHNKVDDIPFGGATGMVIRVEPVKLMLEEINTEGAYVVMTSPQGSKLNQQKLNQLIEKEKLIIISGHYEGIDARISKYVDEEISIGEFVLTGGELPAMVIADALVRLIPGVLGNELSATEDSYSSGLLDWDVYTRPREFDEKQVPEVLLSGDHKKIEQWKKKSAIMNSLVHRPSVLAQYKFNNEEVKVLKNLLKEDEIA
jgi:tRNA (guanine37-N1)-methyltransferase